MSFIISCIIVASFFLVPLWCYRKIYFKDVSCVLIEPTYTDRGKVSISHVRPGRRAFKNAMSNENYSFVSLGSGFYALYGHESTKPLLFCEDMLFTGNVMIFKRNRFGRFSSVDLSSRILITIIKKFD